jgi:hypothetical protein
MARRRAVSGHVIIGKHIARIGDLTSANAETLITNGSVCYPASSIFSHAMPAALSTAVVC